MRITKLHIKRPWKNRFAYWLYDKWCKEVYFPEGKVFVNEYKASSNRIVYRISWIPKEFVSGIHETFIDKK